MDKGSNWAVTLLTWLIVAAAAVVAFKLALAVAGALVGLVTFLLFTVLPLAVVGWVIVKLVRFFRRDDEYRPA